MKIKRQDIGKHAYSLALGWVRILKVDMDSDIVEVVSEKNNARRFFTTDGKSHVKDVYQTLFWNAIKINNKKFPKEKKQRKIKICACDMCSCLDYDGYACHKFKGLLQYVEVEYFDYSEKENDLED